MKEIRHATLGTIRLEEIDERKYFVGKDVAKILELKDTSKAFKKVGEQDKLLRLIGEGGQRRKMMLVSENGLRGFLRTLGTDKAAALRQWLEEEMTAMQAENPLGLIPVEWQEQRVLTTSQLAENYGCTENNIKSNFRNNADRFVEGKHYFKLEGEALATFKSLVKNFNLAHAFAPELYLWTQQGAARHAKMLSTDKAWEVFELLEESYFNRKQTFLPAESPDLKKELIMLKKQIGTVKSLELAVVYVLLMETGAVKIGMTNNLTERIRQIKAETGREVLNYRSTPFMSREEAARLEKSLLDKFAANNLGGEFFDARFVEVAALL